ncbi:hypothetical protein HOU35_gp058 [Acinetobacter phage vB_AbaM_B09_Aci05]|uniref:Uncharacterized protein n=1 Tax=Acinetobacter phage vB_AbaM_B09_Aci05 TaxID=2315458 RepID=A0A386KC71_9CAUD|nr:hypothetical protein HOU35_gp058 [Acinetobacter phage vB_AbaM_B09_Aci05]AYD82362.1 hypothetical protein Aci05_119 [Acinetobacter phage vB_AbaM_B09_Aci05]
MKARREFKVWKLSEAEILNKTLFDLLGKEEVEKRFYEAFKKLGVLQRYDEFYLNKIGNRKVENYISTLRELNGQVATKFYKVEHNAFMTGLLREADKIDGVYFAALYPNFMNKMNAAAKVHWGLIPIEGDVLDGKSHLIYVIKKEHGVATSEQAKELPVPLGHWEGGRGKIAKLKRRKDRK